MPAALKYGLENGAYDTAIAYGAAGRFHCCRPLLVSSLLHQNPRAIVIMIASFRNKGLRRFYESGSLAGMQPRHANRLGILLLALDSAATAADMDLPGFHLIQANLFDKSISRRTGSAGVPARSSSVLRRQRWDGY